MTRVSARTCAATAAFLIFSSTSTRAWDPIRDLTGKRLDEHVDHVIGELENAPESWSRCISRPADCAEETLKRIPYSAIWPLLETYYSNLFSQAEGRWQPLPDDFIRHAQRFYSIDLVNIRYAESIDTWDGSAVAFENYLFFPRAINLSDINDVHWMLHEIEHSVQYANRGGHQALLGEYALKSVGKILEEGTFDVHDFIDLERAADAKANQAAWEVHAGSRGSYLWFQNNCDLDVGLGVRYKSISGTWLTAAWFTMPGNEGNYLEYGGSRVRSENSIFYYYARTVDSRLEWKGDEWREVYDEQYPMRKVQLSVNAEDEWVLGISCD